jgi:predicted permease
MLAGFFVRLKALLFRHRTNAELDEEMRYHLERETERNVARGMTPDSAAAAARRSFGNPTLATEQARDAWRWTWLEEGRQDVHYAIRSFRRAPALVATVAITIGVGLGLLVTTFTLFNAYVLRPLAVRDPYALYDVAWRARNGTFHTFTQDQYTRISRANVGFSQTFGYRNLFTRIDGRAMLGQLVSGNYFDMLGVPPVLGRVITPADDAAPGAGPVVVLSHDTWLVQFGGDSGVVGKHIRLNGVQLTIIGVTPKGFGGLSSWPFQFWVPLSMAEPLNGWKRIRTIPKSAEDTRMVGRVAPGVTPDQASARLAAWLRNDLPDAKPEARVGEVDLVSQATSMPISAELIAVFSPIVIAFGLVMLIACANVANMMLARGLARQREVGIRLALGAGRSRLIRQMLTESIVLALPAGLVAFIISRATIDLGMRVILATLPAEYTPYMRPIDLAPDARVFLFVLGAAIVAAMMFGTLPALQATRPDIVRASRGDFDTPFRPSRLRNALVIAQISVSVLLMTCAGVLLRSARDAQELNPGFEAREVVLLEVLERSRSRVLDAIGLQPDVRVVATAASYPLDGDFPRVAINTARDSNLVVRYNLVSPTYFAAIGLPVLRGRNFAETEARGGGAAGVVLVSAGTAKTLWPGADALGQSITLANDPSVRDNVAKYRSARVIGIVGNASPGWIGIDSDVPVIYYPQPLATPTSAVIVRVSTDATAMRDRIERAATVVDSGTVQEIHTLASSFAIQAFPFRSGYLLSAVVGVLALGLTITGVYGVIGYAVAQRRREFGIRIALGAQPMGLVAQVLRQAMRLALIGFGIGMTMALGVSRGFAAVMQHVNTYDPRGYATAAAVVLGACVVAAYLPSRRAGKVNAVEALRADS